MKKLSIILLILTLVFSVGLFANGEKKSNYNQLFKSPQVTNSNFNNVQYTVSKDRTNSRFDHVVYGGNSTSGDYGAIDLADGTVTATGTIATDPFPMAEEFDGTTLYRIYADLSIVSVNPDDGTTSALGSISGIAGTPTGLAYNWETSVMYIVVLDGSNLPHYGTLDLTTYEATEIGVGASMMIAMDFANDGFLYGPSLDDNLVKIDPADGSETVVGPLGLDINYGQDVSWDYNTSMLYTITCGAAYSLGTYDLETGAFNEIVSMGEDQYATFVCTNVAAAPTAPAAPTDFTAVADADGALEVVLNWTNPAFDIAGETLTDLNEIKVYRDDVEIHSITDPTIGGSETYTDMPDASATYSYSVIGINDNGEGMPTSAEVWAGEDVPGAVTNLVLENVDNNGSLTWENPTEGMHGGPFNEAIIGYHVVRSDGAEFELTGAATSFVDDSVTDANYYSYSVQAYNIVGDGETIISNEIWIGDAFSGILIIDLDTTPNGEALKASIENSYNGPVAIATAANEFPITSEIEAVFLCLGIYSNNTQLTEEMVGPLTSYLDAGGSVYLEGGDAFGFDSPTSLHPYFGVNAATDGASDLTAIDGADFLAGNSWTYTGENNWIDTYDALAETATPLFTNADVGYTCGAKNITDTYKTVATSFEITGLSASRMDNAVSAILDFLIGGGEPNPYEAPTALTGTFNENYERVELAWTAPEAEFADNFDSYTAGDMIAEASPWWTTWGGNPGGTDDAYISDEMAYSGENSLFVNDNPASDVVAQFGNLTTGQYNFDLQVYVTPEHGSYFNLLHKYGVENEWGIDVYFNADGSGKVVAGGEETTFSYTHEEWIACNVNIDLDNDQAIFSMNDEEVYTWQWSLNGSDGAEGTCQLAALDIYAAADVTPGSYFDDISLTKVTSERNILGYNVYRNNTMINEEPTYQVTTNDYDMDLNSDVNYYVTAVYAGGESDASNQVTVNTEVQTFEAPVSPAVEMDTDSGIASMSWLAPGSAGGETGYIGYCSEENNDAIGMADGGTFSVAAKWDNLNDFNSITKVRIFIYSETAEYTLKIWKGENAGEEVYSEALSGYTPAAWNEFELTEAIEIDNNFEYWVGYEIVQQPAEYGAGCDAGPAVAGYGDMLSTDGSTWVSISTEYGLDFNWNIEAYVTGDGNREFVINNSNNNVVPVNSEFTLAGKGYGTTSVTRDVESYNVYLDGSEFATDITDLSYDLDLDGYDAADYAFGVSAVYADGESEIVEVEAYVDQNDAHIVTALNANYPNPFSISNAERGIGTTISFDVKELTNVTIDIYNIKGQKVTQLVNDKFEAGNHTVTWNAQNSSNKTVGTGVYFYRMKGGKYTSTKKMILIK